MAVLILLVLAAFFVRFHQFHDYLLFRSDQERDARIARVAFENGPEYLRLLGPKIARVELPEDEGNGDTSNLGPYYYYVQYFSAKIFNSVDPWVFAVPDFVLSLFSIALFYFLLREFFSKTISVATASISSFSFILLQYSRFAWNPNQIVFWSLLFLLSIYKSVLEPNQKRKTIWFLLSFLSVLVLSQLHVMALFGFPTIMLVFWIIKRPKISWKSWLVALGIILFFYSPVIVSDYANNGDNLKRFVALFTQEGSEESLGENFIEAAEHHSMFYSLALTSFDKHQVDFIEIASIIFILASLVLLAIYFFKNKNQKNEKKKIFILLILIYFFVFFLIYVKTAQRIHRPRYWMPVAVLPYIFLAFWFYLIEKSKRGSKFLIIAITLILISLNFYAIYWFYGSIKNGEDLEWAYREKTKSRPYREMINFKQMKTTVDIMASEAEKKNNQLCYFYDSHQFKNGIKYFLENYYPEIKFLHSNEPKEIKQYNCAIFTITDYDDDKEEMEEDFNSAFRLEKTYTIKPLKIWQFSNKMDSSGKKPLIYFRRNDREEKIEEDKIFYWKEIFN